MEGLVYFSGGRGISPVAFESAGSSSAVVGVSPLTGQWDQTAARTLPTKQLERALKAHGNETKAAWLKAPL